MAQGSEWRRGESDVGERVPQERKRHKRESGAGE